MLSSLLPLVAGAKVTYDDDILPIFEQVCLNCHNPDKTKGGLDLSSYAGALKGSSGGKIVEAGDSSSSLLAVVRQASEPKMPPEGDPLSSAQIGILQKWIEGGLLENKSSSARKPTKPKFDSTIQSDPGAAPDGPPPMPRHVVLEPEVVALRASAVQSMVASPWAPLLAVTAQRQVLLFHTESLELIGVLPFPEGDPVSLAFTPNARYLIVGGGVPGKSGRTVTFDVTTGERMLVAGKEFDTVTAADLHPDLNKVATGSPSRLIKIWKTEDGSQLSSIKKHTDWVTALDFSPDGILLGTGDRNGGLWVWESESANEFHTLRGHQDGITAVSFRQDSNILASASEDGSVRFWEMNQGKEIKKIDAHPGGVLAFAWARNGWFATAGRNRKARIWKPDFGPHREFNDLSDIPTSIALDAEATRVFIGDYNGLIVVHDAKDGRRLGQMHTNPPSIKTRLAKLNEKINKHPETLKPSEHPVAKSSNELKAVKTELEKLKKAREYWLAAQLNARSAVASKNAQRLTSEAEKLGAEFTEIARALEVSRNELGGKRQERSVVAKHIKTSDAGLSEELKSVRATLDAVITEKSCRLADQEKGLIQARKLVDQRLSEATAAGLEAENLKNAYFSKLAATP